MRTYAVLFAAALALFIVGCGGTTDGGGFLDTSATDGTTAATASTSGGNGTSGFSLADVVGSFTGPFSGANTQNLKYKGTGTASILANGTATFGYQAETLGNVQINMDRSFSGSLDTTGKFTGTTAQVPIGGGTVQYFPATGVVTEVTKTSITVQIKWAYPYSNGGTFYTSTESWQIAKT